MRAAGLHGGASISNQAGCDEPGAQRGADRGGPFQHRHVPAIGHDHELAAGDLRGHGRVLRRTAPAILAAGEQQRGALNLFQDRGWRPAGPDSARTCAAKISGVLRDIISMIEFTRAVSLMRRESIMGGSHCRQHRVHALRLRQRDQLAALAGFFFAGRARRQRQITGVEQRDARRRDCGASR